MWHQNRHCDDITCDVMSWATRAAAVTLGGCLTDHHGLFLRGPPHVQGGPRVFCVRDLGAARVAAVTPRGLCDHHRLFVRSVDVDRYSRVFCIRLLNIQRYSRVFRFRFLYVDRYSRVFRFRFLYVERYSRVFCFRFWYVVRVGFLTSVAIGASCQEKDNSP